LFNFHTHYIDEVPCLLNADVRHWLEGAYPSRVALSVGLHPWCVAADWQEEFSLVRAAAMDERVWAIGECGLDKVRGAALPLQTEAFRAHVLLAEEVRKPLVLHCVKAYDELLALRREVERQCKQRSCVPQPWVLHGFRGGPEQAKQLMAKGFLFSFGHQYNIETLRFVFACSKDALVSGSSCDDGLSGSSEALALNPFFLETDDSRLSVRQIYDQVAHHLGVDVARLERLCDPHQTIFR
jgi:TatD DNase family protein